ncbi:MAG TPA: carboxypeptidase regulatory-like domain-containing protein [Planctomycetota bacterium]
MTSVPAPDRLLADAAWLRRLTHHLTGDAALADDLQQDVAVAALAQPLAAAAGRSWLAAVAHNLAVSRRRRRALEQRALTRLPVREQVPQPAALAAEAELQQKAVAAVLALPQVYRDTVLLRFMRGLSLQATSQAMGVPEESVRTRQQRALRMLRAQLAPEGRQRRGLAVLLGGLVASGVAMKSKHAVAVGAAALFALLLAVPFWLQRDALEPGERSAPAAPVRAAVTQSAPAASTAVAPARTEVASAAATADLASLTVHLTWREDGTPVTGVDVICHRGKRAGVFATTNEAGEATFLGLEPGEYQAGTYDWHTERIVIAAGSEARVEHSLERGRSAEGLVVDHLGKPVADASILVSASGIVPQWTFTAGRSDQAGRFSCRGLGYGGLVGASHPARGTSEFRMLIDEQGVERPEQIVLRLPAASITVTGRVVDAAARPVAGAWVELGCYREAMRQDEGGGLWQPQPASLLTTDADGAFTANGLAEEDCPLLVYHAGFAPFRGTVRAAAHGPVWSPPSGIFTAALTITLHPGAVITGSVHDAAGNPVRGAEVEHEVYQFPWATGGETAADGTFRIEDLPPGETTLEVIAKDFPRQSRTFAIAGTETHEWQVVLKREHAIRGRLVDHAGAALANWFVQLPRADRRTKTDAEGRFLLAECQAAGNTLIVRDQHGFVPERCRITGVAASEQEQVFTVPADSAPSARVTGRCIVPAGMPLDGIGLELGQDGWPITGEQRQCGADGTFALGPLPPGSYLLQPFHRQLVFRPVVLELAANESRDLASVQGERPARLVLRLLGDEEACAGAEIRLIAGALQSTSEAGGRERTFGRLFPARYRIVVRAGGKDLDAGEVELAAGSESMRDVTVR